jgi:hypothetical protein
VGRRDVRGRVRVKSGPRRSPRLRRIRNNVSRRARNEGHPISLNRRLNLKSRRAHGSLRRISLFASLPSSLILRTRIYCPAAPFLPSRTLRAFPNWRPCPGRTASYAAREAERSPQTNRWALDWPPPCTHPILQCLCDRDHRNAQVRGVCLRPSGHPISVLTSV